MPPYASANRTLLGCGVVAPPLFVSVFVVTGALRDGYDPAYHPVSALSLGGLGWIQIVSFVVTGGLLTAFAVGLRRVMRPAPGSRWTPILIGVFGVGLILSGVFVMDPLPSFPPGSTVPEGAASWHHTLHGYAGLVVFGAVSLAGFTAARWFAGQPVRRGWMWYSLLTGALVAVLMIAFGTAYEADYRAAGLIQRVMIIVGWTWVVLLALRLVSYEGARATSVTAAA